MSDRAAPAARPGTNAPELTVSELAGSIKRSLEDEFGHVRLRGEISGYRGPHSSGHCYFALKDDKAKIEAVVWRGVFQKLKVKPEEGMEVVAVGRVTTYPGSSKYQIVIDALEPAGVGALMALLEERKRKLAAEGLFDPARKRKLPFLPRVVGIVTSPTGAVIRDMLHGFNERFPTRVVVWPVRVQGETSAAEVAAAVRGFNQLPDQGGPVPRPDVLIIARGGGSLEDLWGFNDETLVRAVAASRIPVISAVGHETDWTLIDLVADARAPTPTKAAEWAVPKHSDLIAQTGDLGVRLGVALRRMLEGLRAHLKAATRGLPRLEDLLALPRQRFDAIERRLGQALLANTRAHTLRHAKVAARLQPRLLSALATRAGERVAMLDRRQRDALGRIAALRRTRLERSAARLRPAAIGQRIAVTSERLNVLAQRARRALATRLAQRRQRLDAQGQMLASLSYQSALRRGFTLLRDGEGRMVRRAAQIASGMSLAIELSDGHVAATATSVTLHPPAAPQTDVAPTADQAPRRFERKPRDTGSGNQGTLF